MKKVFAAVCLMSLLLTMAPLGVMATEVNETAEATQAVEATQPLLREPGYCGENVTWSYSGGTLTISGSGKMDDYIDAAPPWANYRHDITRVVFTGGVSYVGAYAFTDYDELEAVDFGSAMHTIGEQAFKSCGGLTSITLPASFRCFSKECFMSCENLTEIWCQGGMPSFRGNCLWDTYATIYYPPNNAWPAEPVWQLLESFRHRIQIQPGTPTSQPAPTQPAPTEAPTQATEPPVTQPVTVPETTQPATVPATVATEPVETTPQTRETTPRMTEPEWLNETYEAQQEQKPEKKGGLNGLMFGLFLITGILSLILIGALVFRRRRY